MKKDYTKLWLIFVNISPQQGMKFVDLVDLEQNESTEDEYIGAWANIIIKADTIQEAIEIVYEGLAEKNFVISFIDKIENLESLIEKNELKMDVLKEVNWLLKSNYVFKISDKLFPYC